MTYICRLVLLETTACPLGMSETLHQWGQTPCCRYTVQWNQKWSRQKQSLALLQDSRGHHNLWLKSDNDKHLHEYEVKSANSSSRSYVCTVEVDYSRQALRPCRCTQQHSASESGSLYHKRTERIRPGRRKSARRPPRFHAREFRVGRMKNDLVKLEYLQLITQVWAMLKRASFSIAFRMRRDGWPRIATAW